MNITLSDNYDLMFPVGSLIVAYSADAHTSGGVADVTKIVVRQNKDGIFVLQSRKSHAFISTFVQSHKEVIITGGETKIQTPHRSDTKLEP
jgi:hypothetical protein